MRKSLNSLNNQNLLDEGYCEDPLNVRSLLSAPLPEWLLQLSVTERTGYVINIISHLPTSQVAEIENHLRPRLYINFFEHLPNEVLLLILSFLDPISLLSTARVSRQWMSLALDSRLWKQLYLREGFRVIGSEVDIFEKGLNQIIDGSRDLDIDLFGNSIESPISHNMSRQTKAKPETIVCDQVKLKESLPGSKLREGNAQREGNLYDLIGTSSGLSNSTLDQMSQNYLRKPASIGFILNPNISSLFVLDHHSNQTKYKLNWQYLYSQRRRLEANWQLEKYVNFQLPNPNHPEEAHNECIYTIQYSGKYLVSGSRDKTIRIWNLETRRLVRPPLRAHSGSVLCLQFDADPKEDLIVSGSSDATIVLWKFSTGKIIQRLRTAHKESVLNVQFDKRILVTCSKDRTIKIFNRSPMYIGNSNYSADAQTVNPVPKILNNYGFSLSSTSGVLIKPAYSLIATLEGHVAAVNAVQIHGNEIVSASGDRLIKVWNWPEQTCVRTLVGHTKGIACVQYDGRRIVSGSSDNEVKVFDKETGLEVASLRGHSNLVRTVQAGFGDLPFSSEADITDKKVADYDYFKAHGSARISDIGISGEKQPQGLTSRQPENVTALGTKLQSGGGGGKFGRIVSGSYDETIIIWRRDKEGIWKSQHILRQEEAAKAALRNTQVHSESPEIFVQRIFYNQLIKDAVIKGPSALRYALAAYPQALHYQEYLKNQISNSCQNTQQAMQMIVAEAISSNQVISQLHLPTDQLSNDQRCSPNSIQPTQRFHFATSETRTNLHMAATQTSTSLTNNTPSYGSTTNHSLVNQTSTQNVHNLPNQPINGEITRVFKLQFDARRIVCCSQTNAIVGWDFANNDQKIMEASRFFAPIH
ncbi:putative f-box wd-40 repeat-containing protein [Erysiphe necator]|uniref:Putative f-box wd-40 repeat-containing protein n=1 Tax=Uncinula necator TaxID=52586 RepID=A0A0B1P1S9_UNCNE|nr:putative f-box wd-40 repeat-containing protein [Erysiphe necator]